MSSIIVIGALGLLALLSGVSANTSELKAALALAQLTTTLLLIAGIVAIVFASLLCANKKGKVMAIILIALMAALAVMEFMGANSVDTNGDQILNTSAIVFGILCVIDVGILAGYLAVKENVQQPMEY